MVAANPRDAMAGVAGAAAAESSALVRVIVSGADGTGAAEAARPWSVAPGARLTASRSTKPGRGTNSPPAVTSSTGTVTRRARPSEERQPGTRPAWRGVSSRGVNGGSTAGVPEEGMVESWSLSPISGIPLKG